MAVTVAVLAGGAGSRIGGEKPLMQLGGRPLISYPLVAAQAAALDAVVVAKRHTRLPSLDVPILVEPDEPTHPLLGIITALSHFPAVLAVPCDMPFLAPADLAALGAMPDDVATLWQAEPLPALYRSPLLFQLKRALQAGASVRSTQAQPSPARAAIASTRPLAQLAVNTPEDLAAAEARIDRR